MKSCRRCRGWRQRASSCRDLHGERGECRALVATASQDGQRRAWEDGWPSGLQSHWRTGLAHGADRGRARGDRAQAHDGTRRTRRCRQLWHGLEFHPSRGHELQKKSVLPAEQDRPDVARRRARWKKYQTRIDPARLVFIDETWIKTNMAPIRGWCARGRRLAAKVPHGHWKTMTFLAALRCDRIEAAWVLDGPINGESFRTYVDQRLVPTLKPGDVVILDHLGSH